MRLLLSHSRWFFGLLLASAVFALAGCASPEGENLSERPWNTPQSWEGGMPVMNQQHP